MMNEMTLSELASELRQGKRVILQVRHAERPKMDPDDPTFGDSLPITAEGIRTSRLFGETFKDFASVTQFYASPLTRTQMTARMIAEGMGIPNAEIPTDDLIGNGSFYYVNPAEVLDVFKPQNFFNACFEYFRTHHQRGFKELFKATDELEDWLFAHFKDQFFIVATHDLYIAAFLYARGAVKEFTRENWTRFLDGGAIIIEKDGSRKYAFIRSGLSTGICGVGGKVQ